MNEHLLRMRDDVKFCVFDFETEDLNLHTSKPWQFACIVATNKTILRRHDIMLRWPDLNISKEAEMITRFDRLRWEAHGKNPKEVFELAEQEFAEADYIAGHNILGYDIEVYRSCCKRLGLKPYPIERKIIDTFACGKGIKLEIFYKPGENFLHYQLRLLSHIVMKRGFATLAAFAKLYDVPMDETKLHDALYDVELNLRVLRKMLWQIEI